MYHLECCDGSNYTFDDLDFHMREILRDYDYAKIIYGLEDTNVYLYISDAVAIEDADGENADATIEITTKEAVAFVEFLEASGIHMLNY